MLNESTSSYLGRLLRHYREEAALSQPELARKLAHVGYPVSNSTISHYERGTRQVSGDFLVRFVEVLDLNSDQVSALVNIVGADYTLLFFKTYLPILKSRPELREKGSELLSSLQLIYSSLDIDALSTEKFFSCFVSYSSKDQIFAKNLYVDLQQKGVPCWFAPEDMKIGDKIRPTIDQSIRLHDKLLLILSENSLNSFWVESEVEEAFEEERQRGQTVLFPVRLDEAVMETDQSWAAEIRRTRHIGDFTRWKDHDAYQSAFERLLRDLKAEE